MKFTKNISVIYSDSIIAPLEYIKTLNKKLTSSILLSDENSYRHTDYKTLKLISNGSDYHINDELPENRVYLIWANSTSIITTEFKKLLKNKNITAFIFTESQNWFKLKEYNKIDLLYDSRMMKITFNLNGRVLDGKTITDFILREFKFNRVLNKKY